MAEIFNINMSEDMQNIIQQIQIEKSVNPFRSYERNKEGKWINFNGNMYDVIYKGIKDTSNKNSDDLCHQGSILISKILNKLADKLEKGLNNTNSKKIFWLRFETPDPMFDIPRWHIDGSYFGNDMKIVASLKGNGTMIAQCKNNKEMIQNMNQIQRQYPTHVKNGDKFEFNSENYAKYNEIISPILEKDCNIIQLNNFQGAVYNVGSNEISCIHSEPNKSNSRLFIAVVCGENH